MLERLLKSKTEVKVLSVVLFHDGMHLREIARWADISPPQAKKELDSLIGMGVLLKEEKGNLRLYRKKPDCPFLKELVGLYLKTDGVVAMLAKAFGKIKGIRYAFIYGSFASGKFTERSDVDVMIVSDIGDGIFSDACFGVQRKTGREVNWVHWTEKEFGGKLEDGGGFVKSVMRGKKIWLAGDEDGFARAVEKE